MCNILSMIEEINKVKIIWFCWESLVYNTHKESSIEYLVLVQRCQSDQNWPNWVRMTSTVTILAHFKISFQLNISRFSQTEISLLANQTATYSPSFSHQIWYNYCRTNDHWPPITIEFVFINHSSPLHRICCHWLLTHQICPVIDAI